MWSDYESRLLRKTPELREPERKFKMTSAEFLRRLHFAYQEGFREGQNQSATPAGNNSTPDFLGDLLGRFGL
jgi:hypothetical protein